MAGRGGGNWSGGSGGNWHGGSGGNWHGGSNWHGGYYGGYRGYGWGGGYWGARYGWGWGYRVAVWLMPVPTRGAIPTATALGPYPVDTTVYIQQESPALTYTPLPQAAPAANSFWYYCVDPAGYYPYVKSCNKSWMQVVPQNNPGSPVAPQLVAMTFAGIVTMSMRLLLLPLAAVVVLGGCVTVPTAPTVMVLPGPQKSLEQFQDDGAACQQFAQNVVAPQGVAAANNAAANAAVGTALGAAAGAIIGSATGQAGQGAAIGAGHGSAVQRAGNQQHGVRVVLADAARLRHGVRAMHVRARQPAAGTGRAAAASGLQLSAAQLSRAGQRAGLCRPAAIRRPIRRHPQDSGRRARAARAAPMSSPV